MSIYRFSGFELDDRLRRLTYRGQLVSLGSRAFDILTVLVSNPGQPVRKEQIIDSVWSGVFVDEGALRVHMNSLRNALRTVSPENLITTVAGRGYCLVTDIECARALGVARPRQRVNLPLLPFDLIGRERMIARWISEPQPRVCMIVGDHGIGKSAVAIEMARRLAASDYEDAYYLDITRHGTDLTTAIASAIGLTSGPVDWSAVSEAIGDRRTLIVLDGCDGVDETFREAVDRLLAWTPGLSILATSVMPLGIKGERVKVVRGLDTAAPGTPANESHAVELFLSCAGGICEIDMSDPSTETLVHALASKLDGSPMLLVRAALDLLDLGLEALVDAAGVTMGSGLNNPGRTKDSPRDDTLPPTRAYFERVGRSHEAFQTIDQAFYTSAMSSHKRQLAMDMYQLDGHRNATDHKDFVPPVDLLGLISGLSERHAARSRGSPTQTTKGKRTAGEATVRLTRASAPLIAS